MNDVDAFLEHHGVKGMRWGVRRAAKAEEKAQKHLRTPEEQAHRERVVIGAAAGAITVGAIAFHMKNNPAAYTSAAKFVAAKQKGAWAVANRQFQKIQVGRLYLDFILNR